MAPKLSRIERKELEITIISKFKGNRKITDEEIARIFPRCTTRTVRNARSNIMRYGTIDRPSKPFGRPAEVTENMWMAIWHELLRRPSLSQQAQADFLYKLYGIRVSRSTISRGVKWTKKWWLLLPKNVTEIFEMIIYIDDPFLSLAKWFSSMKLVMTVSWQYRRRDTPQKAWLQFK